MKRRLACLLCCLILPYCATTARAEAAQDYFDTNEQLEALGVDKTAEALPERTRELLAEAGVGEVTVENLLHLSPAGFFGAVWNAFQRELGRPARMSGVLLGITVLCALLGGLRESGPESGISQLFGAVAVLCMLSSVVAPVLECVAATVDSIRDASLFMLGYIPVFSAAVAAAGQPVTGGAYHAFLFGACQVVSQVVSRTLLPLLSVYLALCIAGSLSPELRADSVCDTLKRVVTWGLGFLMTVFVGVLSVQTMVSGSADALSLKAGKFVISSFVPVVGSALSEALAAAQGCLRLIRTSVGAFGILAAAFLLLPVLLRVFGWMLITTLTRIAADILGVREVSSVMKSCSGVLSILISFLLCYALLMIVAVTVVLLAGAGG